jgi:hypothetical protein
MNKLTDMVVSAVEEKPDDFKTAFEDAMQEKIGQHIAAYKLQIQQGMLGVEEQEPEEEEVEPSDEEIENEAMAQAVEEYLEAHPDETEEQAIEAVLAEIEEAKDEIFNIIDNDKGIEDEDEETQIDEISKRKLANYIKGASNEIGMRWKDNYAGGRKTKERLKKANKLQKRRVGVEKAANKLAVGKYWEETLRDEEEGEDDEKTD